MNIKNIKKLAVKSHQGYGTKGHIHDGLMYKNEQITLVAAAYNKAAHLKA